MLAHVNSANGDVSRPRRLLFVKEQLAWPRSSGHDVHCFHMMRALMQLGHDVSLATVTPVSAESLQGLRLTSCDTLPLPLAHDHSPDDVQPLRLTGLQERFRSYWGIDAARIRAVGRIARQRQADAVVAVGLNVLPYLAAVSRAQRVWYAADEWVWHHLSLLRLTDRSTWVHVRHALFKGLYERVYGPMLDRVWVVSEPERRAMRLVAGVRHVDVLPNGVDGEHYAPLPAEERHSSCVFWGRLDFEPNIQALEWFCRTVWPAVRQAVPAATCSIYGFRPTPLVEALAGHDGIALYPDVPDLRPEIARQAVVVLPFVSGGGIKNKLLEAASMGKAVVCTPRTLGGLCGERPPLITARTPQEWTQALQELWNDAQRRRRLGQAARQWVLTHHTWEAAARAAVTGLEHSRRERMQR